MKRLICISGIVLGAAISFGYSRPNSEKFKTPKLFSYLKREGDTISTGIFDHKILKSIVQNGEILVIDSFKKKYEVQYFTLIYKEVGVYENAEGRPEIMVDLTTHQFDGNKLDSIWQNEMEQRLAWGDTLIFTDILVKSNVGSIYASPMKFFMKNPKKIN